MPAIKGFEQKEIRYYRYSIDWKKYLGWDDRNTHEDEAVRLRKGAMQGLPGLRYRNELKDEVYVHTPSCLQEWNHDVVGPLC